ncbi:hypothetical protein TURU_098456 [Turdus rufiventris]|nr:hypothetical protein TURU_098456 [Turdus rufiventris]
MAPRCRNIVRLIVRLKSKSTEAICPVYQHASGIVGNDPPIPNIHQMLFNNSISGLSQLVAAHASEN